MLNKDYKDMSQALLDERVEFLLVGAYALAAHGYPRATVGIGGLDIPIPSLDDLVRNKRATGRTKDLADVEALESLRESGTTDSLDE